MKGFDKKYKDFPDYILKITEQIWEGKDVESIGKFYTKDIPVRSPFGVTYGNKPVIDATYATLKEFPNRQLLGEDVIWNGNDEIGYHSSHRILSKGTHLGDGFYGKPSGKDIYYRVIADCACKENQVYDEWIVRDQGAMVRQIGYSPKEFAKKIIESEGGISTASKLFDFETDKRFIVTRDDLDGPDEFHQLFVELVTNAEAQIERKAERSYVISATAVEIQSEEVKKEPPKLIFRMDLEDKMTFKGLQNLLGTMTDLNGIKTVWKQKFYCFGTEQFLFQNGKYFCFPTKKTVLLNRFGTWPHKELNHFCFFWL